MTMTKWLIGGGVAVAALAVGAYSYQAKAADLGESGCCADLEERVAELEATVSRKGNRKVKLTISGEVSRALLWHDVDPLPGANKLRVIDNPNSGTKLRFSGEAKMSTSVKAGFMVELGYDETAGNLLGVGDQVDDLTIRHSVVWLEGGIGKLSLGRTSTATDGIAEIDLANTNIASLPMSLEPLWTQSGLPGLGFGILNPVGFDGGRANIVRYDTPHLGGFQASAAWGGGQTASGDDLYDFALRYAGEFGGLRFAAGAGYRVESFNSAGISDMKTLAGSASLLHVSTGLFTTVYGGRQEDHPAYADLQMWQVRGGLHRNWFGIGATSLFAEYGDHRLTTFDVDSTFVGGGVVQQIDSLAMDIFASYRSYDIGGGFDASTAMVGARIRF